MSIRTTWYRVKNTNRCGILHRRNGGVPRTVMIQFGSSGPFENWRLRDVEEITSEEAERLGYEGIGG